MEEVAHVEFAHCEECRTSCTFKQLSALQSVKKKSEYVESPVLFTVNGHEFVLRFFPNGSESAEAAGYMSLFLHRKSGPKELVVARFCAAIGGAHADCLAAKVNYHDYSGGEQMFGYPKFKTLQELKEIAGNRDALTVSVHAMVCAGKYSTSNERRSSCSKLNSMAADWAQVLESGVGFDLDFNLMHYFSHVPLFTVTLQAPACVLACFAVLLGCLPSFFGIHLIGSFKKLMA